ncbi:MAG: alkaline phosphatase family protein, partial [Clostridia bacterium]|nr:alkaline phosphatase family protein [Clostridia bacterium]
MDEQLLNEISLTGVCASLAEAMGIPAPANANPSIPAITEMVKKNCGRVDRVFMYNPDAVAMWLYQKYTSFYTPLQNHVRLSLPLRSVMPSVTPVCFGSMYTGAYPKIHGIRYYTKPIIRIDTIFDSLIRSGKRPVIISESEASLSKIFLERKMDYYICPSTDECTEKALELIEEDRYDFIVLYNGDYDSTMHRHAPEGSESLDVLKKDIGVFDRIAEKITSCWMNHRTL